MNFDQFKRATGLSGAQAERWYPHMEQAMVMAGIAHPRDVTAFLATCHHESGGFVYTAELWGPTKQQLTYASRMGNDSPEAKRYAAAAGMDPGRFYRGYGLIQVTGFDNLAAAGDALGIDLRAAPGSASTDRYAALVSTWWWEANKASKVAIERDFLAVSRLVNFGNANAKGMPIGWEKRKQAYDRAAAVFLTE